MRERIVNYEVTCDRCGRTERVNVDVRGDGEWGPGESIPVVDGWAWIVPAIPLGMWPRQRQEREVCPDCISVEEREQLEEYAREREQLERCPQESAHGDPF